MSNVSVELVVFIALGAMVLYVATQDFRNYPRPLTRGQIIWTGFRYVIGAGVIIPSVVSLFQV